MPRKLEDIDVEEISLVGSAANRRRFLILKKEIQMGWLELLKSFLGGEEENEEFKLTEEDIAKAKEMSESAIKAISGALNILNKYKDVFPPDVIAAMKTLTKYAAYGYPEKKSAELEDEEFTKYLIEKAGAKLSKATIEQLEKIKDIVEKLIGAKDKDVKKGLTDDEYEKLPADIKVRLARATELEEAEKDRVKKAQENEEAEREKRIKTLEDEIAELKKSRGKKKGLKPEEDDDEHDDKDKDEDDDYTKSVKKNKGPLWPSLISKEED